MAGKTTTGTSSPGGFTRPWLASTRTPAMLSRGLLRFLNAPHQAIIETSADLVVSFDFGKFNAAIQSAITSNLNARSRNEPDPLSGCGGHPGLHVPPGDGPGGGPSFGHVHSAATSPAGAIQGPGS